MFESAAPGSSIKACLKHGPEIAAPGVLYRLWSPQARKISVIVRKNPANHPRSVEMKPTGGGWFLATDDGGRANDLYEFLIDDSVTVPDVASRFQPFGVRGPSQVMDSNGFSWANSSWKRPGLENLIIYELHVGTFTSEGTFASVIPRLEHIKELGVNAVQLMPVGAFPGSRNWGYDVVLPYAPAEAYGTPDDLRALVDAAHGHGLAVIVDVVYNHVCGEPNYLQAISPEYFRKEEGTPWGSSLNFELPAVRAFFLENAGYWFDEFHVDGLRLDATHAIVDNSEPHILQEIADAAHLRGGFVIAEDDRNEVRLLKPKTEGGLGMDAVWADDFHHVLKMSLKPEPVGHFKNYQGTLPEMIETLDHGWLFRGRVFPQWKKPRGTDARNRPAAQFIYCISNHDQTGNRPLGERLNQLISPGAYHAASMFFLLLPYTPMLFMGQEWAATTPFVFFSDHRGTFGAAVSQGRLKEFKQFGSEWPAEMLEKMPDPESLEAFSRSKLNWQDCKDPVHHQVFELYRECIQRRRTDPVLQKRQRNNWKIWGEGGCVFVQYGLEEKSARLLIAHFGPGRSKDIALPEPPGGNSKWGKIFSSNEKRFGGDGLQPFVVNDEICFTGVSAILLGGGK